MRVRASPHTWIVGAAPPARRPDRPGAPVHIVIDAHRRHAGPYTAAGRLVSRWLRTRAGIGLAHDHLLTVLSVAPDLWTRIPVDDALRRAFEFSREGNAPSWTLRLAHGLVAFVSAYVDRPKAARAVLTFTHVDEADPTDQQFIAALLPRVNPHRLRIHVHMSARAVTPALRQALQAHARRRPTRRVRRLAHVPGVTRSPGAWLAAASSYMRLAYYDAALEAARAGRALLDPGDRGELCGQLTRHILFALLLLRRFDEVETLSDACLASSVDPALLAHVTYAKAILLARLYVPARRDYDAAARWIERSLAHTAALPASDARTVNLAFLENTMALVDMRQGRHDRALGRLTQALGTLASEAPGRYRTESPILWHNHARLLILTGKVDDAMASYTELLRQEPSNGDALFDRGVLHQRLGQHDAAVADYDAALRWSPPFEEAHFNRAQVLTALGRVSAAIDDYTTVLWLNPDHVDARINRACLLYETARTDEAAADVVKVLRRQPNHARALCLRGLVSLARGRVSLARRHFSAAIDRDPLLADAWANRGVVHASLGLRDEALADLTRALSIKDDPAVRANLARVLAQL